jgi:hypothetical protein
MVAKGKLLNTPNSNDNQHRCTAIIWQYASDTQLANSDYNMAGEMLRFVLKVINLFRR